MIMRKIFILFAVVVLYGCSSESEKLTKQGDLLLAKGKPKAALKVFLKIASIKSNTAIMLRISNSYERLGKFQKAASIIEEITPKDDAQDAKLLYKRGRLAEKNGNIPKAVSIYRLILNKYPNHPKTSMRMVHYLYYKKKVREAQKLLKKILNFKNLPQRIQREAKRLYKE